MNVLGDSRHSAPEQRRHLLLGQPDRIAVDAHVKVDCVVGVLVQSDLLACAGIVHDVYTVADGEEIQNARDVRALRGADFVDPVLQMA